MLDAEILDESGFLEDEPFTVQAPVTLTQKDIRMLQLAKSAICAGLMTLIQNEKLQPLDIQTLYIAGGFGNYLNMQSAARIGLLPNDLTTCSQAVGNAALAGASMFLLNTNIQKESEKLIKRAAILDLSTNPTFSDLYMSGMMLDEI
jgi:uncharacterized 2Fe-2S/4Fe-4S cluster protein (DUF4445 family)